MFKNIGFGNDITTQGSLKHLYSISFGSVAGNKAVVAGSGLAHRTPAPRQHMMGGESLKEGCWRRAEEGKGGGGVRDGEKGR